ncbi:MAG TPA: hypothetical protein VNB64_04635 [Solirubrobacteraceae bacterium]|nr:hypothetical protein [Solirubrobacteraceae bacterium]
MDDLDAAIQRWLKGDAYTVTDEFDLEADENVVAVEPRGAPPQGLAVLIGDCVHNMRSALDNLIYDLSWAQGGPLTKEVATGCEFPVFGPRPPRTSELVKRIGAIDPPAQAVIKALQPHHRGNDFASDPVWVLDQLWNIDKHRSLHLTLFGHAGTGIGAPGEMFHAEHITLLSGPIRQRGRTPLLRYRLKPLPGTKVNMKNAPSFDVAFGQGTPCAGSPVTPTLTALRTYVADQVREPLIRYL